MILEQNKANIETYGDIQQNKVSIDPKNAEHIISILSSNLYSNPEESFLRETISNAVDSHREADTKEPIVLLFKKNGNYYDIIIRDYGTGISPERFDQIYKFIGSSTKRDSNEYIGSFGIGRFSALACADVVHITSYYNGTANVYVMAKNGGGIDIDLISSFQTEEKNGVEIKIQVDDLDSYADSLPKLSYISNLYVTNEGLNSSSYAESCAVRRIVDFNDRKILSYNTFKYNTNVVRCGYRAANIILGNIIYPIDLTKICPISQTFAVLSANHLEYIFESLQVPFEIGSLDVTPNREALLYSPRTIEALKKGYEAALLELKSLYLKFLDENTNIIDFWRQCRMGRALCLKKDDVTLNVIIPDSLCKDSLTFKGKTVSDEVIEGLDHFLYLSLDALPISFIVDNSKGLVNAYWKRKTDLRDVLYEGIRHYGTNTRRDINIVRIGSVDSAKSTLIKSFAANVYKNSSKRYTLFIPSYSFRDLVDICINKGDIFKTYNYKGTYNKVWLLKEVIRALSEYVIDDDIEHSDAFIQWKEERKQALKNNKSINFDKPVLGYVCTDRYYFRKFEFKNLDEFQNALKRYTNLDDDERNRPVIYGELHSKYWNIFEALASNKTLDRFIRVKTAQSNMKYFKNISKKWIHIEDYLPRMQEFKMYLTYRKFRNEELDKSMYGNLCRSFLERICSCLTDKEEKAVKLCKNYSAPNFTSSDVDTLNEILNKCKETEENIYDEDLKNAYPIYYKYVRLYEKVSNIIPLFQSEAMLAYFLMKHKLLRMNFEEYKELKDQLKIIVE